MLPPWRTEEAVLSLLLRDLSGSEGRRWEGVHRRVDKEMDAGGCASSEAGTARCCSVLASSVEVAPMPLEPSTGKLLCVTLAEKLQNLTPQAE